jgi:hypothetical protein
MEPPPLPGLAFGSWVGGDRDGHPFVTATVTADTLALLNSNAVSIARERLSQLGARLSMAESTGRVPARLKDRIEKLASELGDAVAQPALSRNPGEPWRQFLNLLLSRLDAARSPQELLADLTLMEESLNEAGMSHVAAMDVRPAIALVRTFGFHLAALDIRQNSAYHDRAIQALLKAAGFPRTDYANWSETEKLEFLNQELRTLRPFATLRTPLDEEGRHMTGLYSVNLFVMGKSNQPLTGLRLTVPGGMDVDAAAATPGIQIASEQRHPLTQADEPQPRTFLLQVHATTVVMHDHTHLARAGTLQHDARLCGSRMLGDVRQAFLDDPEQTADFGIRSFRLNFAELQSLGCARSPC